MINKKKNITIKLILILLAILIAFISYFTINYDFRRDTYKRIVAFINLYQFYSIKQHVQSGDTKSAAKKIDNYINFSQKISKGKNAMWEGIYDVTHMISINAKNQEDFNLMQDVYLKLLDIDDDIYLVHVWASRALLDDDESKSVYHLKKAIILSPSNEEAYREILNLSIYILAWILIFIVVVCKNVISFFFYYRLIDFFVIQFFCFLLTLK